MATAPHHLNARRARWYAALALAVAGALLASAPARAYQWPVKPFDRQHPVRGFFGDPRIAHGKHGLHFGIDVSAPNGTPVYATTTGRVSLKHEDVVVVAGTDGRTFEYWHVVPSVAPGTWATAYRTVLGRVQRPWAHVHLSEVENGRYVNPLRPGALAPYQDATRPQARMLTLERDGRPVGRGPASGVVDVVVEASDATPVAVPAPWTGKPVSPALVRWRIRGAGELGRWMLAADFRDRFPITPFGSVYAPWTRQNHASVRGRYRFYLRHAWDTRSLRDGAYEIEVAVSDTRGNTGRYVAALTVANGSR